MDFITIDFETATSERDSPCEIGLTFVRNREIVETRSWLIKPMYPEFNYWNIKVHGIRPSDVRNQPEFDELWEEIHPMIEGSFLIAHNAGFDINVLRSTLDAYHLPYPNIEYACSVVFSKRIWKNLPAYNLKSLSDYHGIQFRHHRAGADSYATARLAIKAFEEAGIDSLDDFTAKLQLIPGKIQNGEHTPTGIKRKSQELKKK